MSRADPTWWGYSQLKLYRTCPLRYRWEREERRTPPARAASATLPPPGAPAYIGTLFARLVELLYRERWWALDEAVCLAKLRGQLLRLARLETVSSGMQWPPGMEAQAISAVDEALPLVLQTMRTERLIGFQNWTEYLVSFPLDNGDHVTGSADLVTVDETGLTLVDGKSGHPRYADSDQLRLYALGLVHDPRFARLPDRAGFWFFRQGTVAWKKITPTLLGKFRSGVESLVQRLRAGDRDASPGSHCRYCPWLHGCPTGWEYTYSRQTDHGLPEDTNSGTVSL